ncbi:MULTISPECIES: hypothetical protein [Burkholderia]|uniref:Uncharacterized protein n=1 Tax=Burkholderia pseudomallei TaxID=28450 RepID=A0A8A4DVZ0_BURPE|nr:MULTISPECIES: hypothetical protein [Burkholderia]MBF3380079.1 hypothetical protein [Burkholderia pseudomallei]MBF3404352.1 hypothetical protein [Burkholderia pseudomallei]MBF3428649.1 hypothetical protein [Burkholderia pseudomallei]MBF3497722.1 hypothetical protein [Burkholderia pseudomallei]MBF3520683.1 hypothetical protein [Burkholderia pseudomallei]
MMIVLLMVEGNVRTLLMCDSLSGPEFRAAAAASRRGGAEAFAGWGSAENATVCMEAGRGRGRACEPVSVFFALRGAGDR